MTDMGNWQQADIDTVLEDDNITDADAESTLQHKRFELERVTTKQVLDTWTDIQERDCEIRENYGKCLLWVLLSQFIVMDIVLILKGFNVIQIPTEEVPYWLGALVIEAIGLAVVVARGLFKNTTVEFHSLISTLTNKMNKE